MKIILIRHGMTKGNLEKRYVGCTDEPLCEEGRRQIVQAAGAKRYPKADLLYVSPLKRCIETAELIYPDKNYILCDPLKERDFGEFEYKNYLELSTNKDYIDWLKSNGEIPFPAGERTEDFKLRCQIAYEDIISQAAGQDIALVVHGGTIMSILEKYGVPERNFYDWQIKNGEGYLCERILEDQDESKEPVKDEITKHSKTLKVLKKLGGT